MAEAGLLTSNRTLTEALWVFVLHDENLPYISHFHSSYRTNDQFALDGENLTSSIPKIIPTRKIEKIPNKKEKNIIEQFRNWFCIVLNQRKTLKFMRLLRLRTGSPNCILRHKFAVLRSMCKDSIKKTQNNAMFQSENCHKRLHFELSALTDIQSNPIHYF